MAKSNSKLNNTSVRIVDESYTKNLATLTKQLKTINKKHNKETIKELRKQVEKARRLAETKKIIKQKSKRTQDRILLASYDNMTAQLKKSTKLLPKSTILKTKLDTGKVFSKLIIGIKNIYRLVAGTVLSKVLQGIGKLISSFTSGLFGVAIMIGLALFGLPRTTKAIFNDAADSLQKNWPTVYAAIDNLFGIMGGIFDTLTDAVQQIFARFGMHSEKLDLYIFKRDIEKYDSDSVVNSKNLDEQSMVGLQTVIDDLITMSTKESLDADTKKLKSLEKRKIYSSEGNFNLGAALLTVGGVVKNAPATLPIATATAVGAIAVGSIAGTKGRLTVGFNTLLQLSNEDLNALITVGGLSQKERQLVALAIQYKSGKVSDSYINKDNRKVSKSVTMKGSYVDMINSISEDTVKAFPGAPKNLSEYVRSIIVSEGATATSHNPMGGGSGASGLGQLRAPAVAEVMKDKGFLNTFGSRIKYKQGKPDLFDPYTNLAISTWLTAITERQLGFKNVKSDVGDVNLAYFLGVGGYSKFITLENLYPNAPVSAHLDASVINGNPGIFLKNGKPVSMIVAFENMKSARKIGANVIVVTKQIVKEKTIPVPKISGTTSTKTNKSTPTMKN